MSISRRAGVSVSHCINTAEAFDNNGNGDVKALCVVTPAAIGPRFFREAAEVINATPGGPPDRAKMAEIMRRHGLTPAPPQA
jgi:hypothetical protein